MEPRWLRSLSLLGLAMAVVGTRKKSDAIELVVADNISLDFRATTEDLVYHEQAWEKISRRTPEETKRWYLQVLPQVAPQTFGTWPCLDTAVESPEQFTRHFLKTWDEYGWSLDMTGEVFCELAYEGFLPISMEVPTSDEAAPLQVLLPWSDRTRHVLDWHNLHVGKQVRKLSKRYTLSVDAAFDEVILACVRAHSENWLYRGIRSVLRRLFREGYGGSRNIDVGVHSFELWDSDARLVAGDLGYVVGGVYTSLTGFRAPHAASGAGKLQIVLTAAWLWNMGFAWWDLGQVMDYKAELGAHTVVREDFVSRLHADRRRSVFGATAAATIALERGRRFSGEQLLHDFESCRRGAHSPRVRRAISARSMDIADVADLDRRPQEVTC